MIWPEVKISDVCETGSGGTPARAKYDRYYHGTIPWVKSGELEDRLVEGTEEKITEEGLRESSAKLVQRDSVLIALYGATVGKTALLRIDAATNQAVCYLIPNRKVLKSEYLWFVLRSKQKELLAQRVGGAQPNISQAIIRKTKLPLPPLSEQRRIVEILDQADALRKKRAEADKIAERILPALFYKVFGDPIRNEKGWDKKPIQSFCSLVRGSSPRPKADPRYYGGPVPRLMVSDLSRDGLFVNPKTDSLTNEGAALSRPMKKGEVVMAVSGAVGLPAILNEDACIHDGFVGFRDLDKSVNPIYLVVWLNILKPFLSSQAVGAIWQNLKTEQINKWEVPLPPPPMQDGFADRVKEITHLRTTMRRSEEKLNTLVATLTQQAFSSNLTAKWREAHMKELLQEMEEQTKYLGKETSK